MKGREANDTLVEREQAEKRIQKQETANGNLQRQIAGRKGAEQALQESEEQYRRLFEGVPIGIYRTTPDGRILMANPTLLRMLGYSSFEEIATRNLEKDSFEPGYRRSEFKERVERDGEVRGLESTWAKRDGSMISVRENARVIRGEDGRVLYYEGTVEDVSDNKRAEEALLDSEAKNRALLNAIPDSILRFRIDGELLNFKPARDLPSTSALRGVSDLAQQFMQHARKARYTGQTVIFEYQMPVDENLHNYEARIVTTGEDEAVAIVRDVTDKKNMEKQILEISDREQRRIGQDLHDGLCQHLTATAFASKLLEQKLAERSLKEAADAKEIAELINEGIAQARTLARGLYPVQLESDGLPSALEQLASNVQDLFHISCRCECDSAIQIRDRGAAAHLYRIAQEAIHNGIKHGKAKHLCIGLTRSNGDITLTVKDDGIGIPKLLRKHGGMGLNIMSYRAQMIGASFAIHRAKRGTVVTCRLHGQTTGGRRKRNHGQKKTAPAKSQQKENSNR